MLLARLKEEAEAAVEELQPFCVYEGVGIKCGLHYCVAWKMSLHRGGCLGRTDLKKTPTTLTQNGKFTKNVKRTKYEARTMRMYSYFMLP